MMKKKVLVVVLMFSLLVSLAGCQQTKKSGGDETTKEKGGVVKIICGYGAGGTADAIARKYAKVAGTLYPEYDFIVENMTGGDGFAAATYFTELDKDTKELLIYGYGLAYRHDIGKEYGTELVDFDRAEINPVASIDDRTWILYGKEGVSLQDMIEQAKNGGLKMSGGNPLSDPHLALGSLMKQLGGEVMVVPYDGGAAQKKGLTDGEVDVFVGTTQAGQEETEAGTMIPLLAFSDQPFEGFVGPDGALVVPPVAGDEKAAELPADTDFSGSILKAGGFIATRTGGDEVWAGKVEEMSKAVWADKEYADWISEILLNKFEVYGDDAKKELEDASKKAMEAYETLK